MRETLELLDDLLEEGKVVNILGREIELPDGIGEKDVVDHILKITGRTGSGEEQVPSVFNPIKWAKSNGIGRIASFTSDGIGLNAIRIIKNKGLLQILADNKGGLPLPTRRGVYNWSQFTGGTPGFKDLVTGNEVEGSVSTQSLSDPVGKGEIALSFLFGLQKGGGDTDLILDGKGFSVKYMGPRGEDSVNISEGSTKKVFNIASKILYPDAPGSSTERTSSSSTSDIALEMGQAGIIEARNEFLTFVSSRPEINLKSLKATFDRSDGQFTRDVEAAINAALASIDLSLLMTFDNGFRYGDHLDAKFSSISKGRIKIRQRNAGESRSESVNFENANKAYKDEIEAETERAEEKKRDESPTSPYSPSQLEDTSGFVVNKEGVKYLYDFLGIELPPDNRNPPIASDFESWVRKLDGWVSGTSDNPYQPPSADVLPIKGVSKSVVGFLRNVETLMDYAKDARNNPGPGTLDQYNRVKDDVVESLKSALGTERSPSWRSRGGFTPPASIGTKGATMFNHLAEISVGEELTNETASDFVRTYLEDKPQVYQDFLDVVTSLASQQEEKGLPILSKAASELGRDYKQLLNNVMSLRVPKIPGAARETVKQTISQGLEDLRKLAVKALTSTSIQAAGRSRPGPRLMETLSLLEDLLTP